jgi:hypothetical protein
MRGVHATTPRVLDTRGALLGLQPSGKPLKGGTQTLAFELLACVDFAQHGAALLAQ